MNLTIRKHLLVNTTLRGAALQIILDTQKKYREKESRRGKSKIINLLIGELSDQAPQMRNSVLRELSPAYFTSDQKKLKTIVKLEGKSLDFVMATYNSLRERDNSTGKSKIINRLLIILAEERQRKA